VCLLLQDNYFLGKGISQLKVELRGQDTTQFENDSDQHINLSLFFNLCGEKVW
jgi:hypothetical protein